jgi:hypothetical protein
MNYSSQLDNASLQTLKIQAPTHLCWAVISPIGIITNILIIVTVINSKLLHNKSHYVILSHSLAELIYVTTYFCTGLNNYLFYMYQYPRTADQLTCILINFPLILLGNVCKCLTLALAFDRVLCITKPIFYKTLHNSKYILVLNGLSWGYSTVKTSLAFVSYDKTKYYSICSYAVTFDPTYVKIASIENNCLTAVSVLVYALAAIVMWRRYKSTKLIGASQRSEWRRKMDFDVFLVMIVVGIEYIFRYGIISVIGALVAKYPTLSSVLSTSPLTSLIIICGTISHFFIYLGLNKLFRRQFLRLVRKNDQSNINSVSPIVVSIL